MKLHQTSLKVRGKTKQRVGRGGKRGSYSGRGTKGQKSRAGRRIRPAQRDLIIRIPKLRGFRNKIKRDKPIIVNLEDLSFAIQVNSKPGIPLIINKELLVQSGIISRGYKGRIKILSQGKINAPITLTGLAASKATQEKIVKAGGSIAENQKSKIKDQK